MLCHLLSYANNTKNLVIYAGKWMVHVGEVLKCRYKIVMKISGRFVIIGTSETLAPEWGISYDKLGKLCRIDFSISK
jgi:hypothetical protein